jgi:sucrose-6-phosphate hydrolase SacC (GH32 family)
MLAESPDDATGLISGNQHWGHATLKDYYHWENQMIAIFPDNPDQAIFSGSAVVDVNHTLARYLTKAMALLQSTR